MKTFATSVLAIAAVASVHALPSNDLAERDVQSVSLIFQGGPASYNMTIPADGKEYFTNNGLNINLIVSPDYDPYRYCTFKTTGQVALAPSLVQRPEDPWPINEIAVGPPQPIISVKCYGYCLGVYGDCYNTQGQYVAPCCNGFCAADKCRPWNEGST